MYICLMYASYKNTYDNLDIERPMMRSQGCWYHVLYVMARIVGAMCTWPDSFLSRDKVVARSHQRTYAHGALKDE